MFSLQKLKVWAELNWFWVKIGRYHKKNNINSEQFIGLAITTSISSTLLYTLDFSRESIGLIFLDIFKWLEK